MIKGLVHLKILFSLCFSDFKALKHLTLFCLTKKKKEGGKKSACFVAAPSSRQNGESWQQTWTQLIIPQLDLSDCVLAAWALLSVFLSSCLSFFLFLFLSLLLGAFCEGDSTVSQLGLSSLSSDLARTHLTAPFLASAANTHTHTDSSTFNPFLFFLRKTKFHTGI